MIDSKELERQLLSVLIKFPASYGEVAGLIDENDFSIAHGSYVHRTIFKIIKKIQDSGPTEALDEVVLIERLRSANVSFIDNILKPLA